MGHKNSIKNQNGQTFLEFVLLLAIMVSFSYILLKGFNTGIGDLWEKYVRIIANPTTTSIELN